MPNQNTNTLFAQGESASGMSDSSLTVSVSRIQPLSCHHFSVGPLVARPALC